MFNPDKDDRFFIAVNFDQTTVRGRAHGGYQSECGCVLIVQPTRQASRVRLLSTVHSLLEKSLLFLPRPSPFMPSL